MLSDSGGEASRMADYCICACSLGIVMAEILSQEVMYREEEKRFATARDVSLWPPDSQAHDLHPWLREPFSTLQGHLSGVCNINAIFITITTNNNNNNNERQCSCSQIC
jgi:hypothetical protein